MTDMEELLSLGFDDAELIRHLSPQLAEIARVAGMTAVLALVANRRAQKVYIPPVADMNSELSALVGLEAAQKISLHLGNGFSRRLEIPTGLFGRTLQRLKGIRMLRDGATIAQVSIALNVGRTTVKVWKRKYENRLP
jgi:hypothetical protein